MKKYVFITNSVKPSKKIYESTNCVNLDNVSKPCIEAALKLNYDVYVGINRKFPEKIKCREYPIKFYNSHTFRSITAVKDNWIAYKNLCKLLDEGNFECIHCNTPIGGIIGRVCGKKYHIKKIIYTVHGFHFYKGAPLINNLIFKFSEYIMARWTDSIITINQEDYEAALKMPLKPKGKVYKISGVGIDIKKFQNHDVDIAKKRKDLNIGEDLFICIGVGRIEPNKNYETSIKAIKATGNSKIHMLICGVGEPKYEKKIKDLCKKLDVDKQIHFLGFRKDIDELLQISNCYISTSKREGLPRALMEAMASGLPCVVSGIRGNNDLIDNNYGGYSVKGFNEEAYAGALTLLFKNHEKCEEMKLYNLNKIESFGEEKVKEQLYKIYCDLNL